MPNALKIPALAVLVFLSGCSAQQTSSPRFSLKLLPPVEGSLAVLLQQKVILQIGEKQQQFLLVARFEEHRLKMVLLSPTGQQLLMLDYDGDELVQNTQSSIDVPGTLAAQASKYQLSHLRGLIFQRTSVAKIENSIIAKRPAHSAPEP